ncbi:MAG: MFS transporter [Acidobacteria bacterium]|nr:MFS transporter [Acidobacteriota bacterium]
MTVAAAMVFLGFTLVMPFLPFYVESLGVRGVKDIALWSGLFMTISPLLAALLGPIWGRLADRVGMKIMVQRVLFTIALHWGLMYFAANVWQVLGLRIMLGLFSGFGTMSVALVTHGCPRERIGRAVGVLQATQILSTALGPTLGGILAHLIGIRNAFLVTFALCATALFFVRFLYRDIPAGTDEAEAVPIVLPQEGPVSAGVRAVVPRGAGQGGPAGTREGALSMPQIVALPLFAGLLPLLFLLNMVDRSLFLSMPLFIAALAPRGSAVQATVGAVMTAGAAASAASAYLLGRRAVRVAPAHLLIWSLAAGGLAIAPMAICRSVLPLAALRILLGLAVGGAATLAYTIACGVIPGAVRATAYAFLSSIALLGGAVGPILTGLLSALDVRAPFVVGSLVYAALAALAAALARRPRRRPAVGLARPTEGPS